MRFFYYNFFCSHVNANIANGDVLLLQNTAKIKLSKASKIIVKGYCFIGNNSIVELKENSTLIVDALEAKSGNLELSIRKGAELSIGYRTILANNVFISCSKKIEIGGFSYVGNNVSIDDNNNGVVCSNDDTLVSISIGEHCLLNENVVVKRGTQLGDEVIVEANSTVFGKFSPREEIAGVPASTIEKNIFWKK